MGAKELLQELRGDFDTFASRCLYILDKEGNKRSLTMNKAQRHIHECLEQQRHETGKVRALLLKGRQQGASTYMTGRFYDKTSGGFGKRAFILTHEQDATDNLFSMVRRYHENCPAPVRPQTGADNAKSLYFNVLDSRFSVATAGAKETGRSATAQYFLGSEVAFWPNAKKHFAGIGQIVPDEPGTEVVLETTANGIGNVFHTMWQQAMAGEGEYQAVFVPWLWEEGYAKPVPDDFELDGDEIEYMDTHGATMEQMVWRRAKIAELQNDVNLFNQEYPATPAMAFMAAADDALIPPVLVQQAAKTKELEPIGPKMMGVDPAEYGPDSTAIYIRQGRRVLHRWRYHRRGPMEIAGIVANLIDEHQPDAAAVDSTGHGIGVTDRLQELGYGIYPIKFGASALDDRYKDRRSEIWAHMLHWFREEPVEIPDDHRLASDLTSLNYSYNGSRQLVLESKEHAKSDRGIESPDDADALALTFAVNVAPSKVKSQSYKWRDRLKKQRRRSTQAA